MEHTAPFTMNDPSNAVVLREQPRAGDGPPYGEDDGIDIDLQLSDALDAAQKADDAQQRLGSILTPAEGQFETLNRVARKGLWPSSPIRKTQGAVGDQEVYFGVEIRDADQKWHLASSKSKLLSPNYLLVHNDEIKAMAEEVARRTGHDFVPVRETFDGTRYEYYLASPAFVNRVGDLREIERGNHTLLNGGFGDALDPNGDYVRLGLRAVNTYDGSARARVEAYVERLVCLNGALVKDGLFSFTFEHKVSTNGGRRQWEAELERAGYELRNLHTRFDAFAETLRQMREREVGMDELRAFARHKAIRSLPAAFRGDFLGRFLADEEPTLFGLYNAATYCTWHAGERLTQADVKRNEDLVALLTDPAISLN